MTITLSPPTALGEPFPHTGGRVVARLNHELAAFSRTHGRRAASGVLFHEGGRVIAVQIEDEPRVDLTQPLCRRAA